MHVFCYECLLKWFQDGRVSCPVCDRPVEEVPIRDDRLELDLAEAIRVGTVTRSEKQLTIRVGGNDKDYTWEEIHF